MLEWEAGHLSHTWTSSLEACKDQNLVLCPSYIPWQGVNVCMREQHRAVLHI